jgi:TRAP-type C4-dicarboxylate transport system permease small subunit
MDNEDHHGPLIDTTIPRRMPEFIIGAGLLVVFVALTVTQVITRYVMNAPLQWTEELAAHLLIWMVFIGAIGVHRRDTHLRVEMLDEWVPPRVVAGIRLVFDFAVLIVLVLMVKSGWDLYQSMRFDKLPALRWPIRNIIIIAPIASAIMAIYSVSHIIGRIKILWGKSDG